MEKEKGKRFRHEKQEPFQNLIKESEKFVTYYKNQNLIPEEEWDNFIAVMKTSLPTTFRITGGNVFAPEIRRKLENDFLSKDKLEPVTLEDGSIVNPPKPLPWYPENNGWYFKATKKDIRKVKGLEEFHKFLVAQTDNGNISRQEAVSMIPPFFLDVKPHHRVIDMCAAPGSKTAQITEAIHAANDGKVPSGIVVANDITRERCYMLVHQIQRLSSPCVIVSCHEAQNFPFLKVKATPEELQANLEGHTKDGKITFQFDRVLADVPCSGDGAMRKIPEMWQKWSPAIGHGMHRLQIKIAFRGAKLLKVGGRMVYSTCSLNPVEDEAVVAELLRLCKGALKILDVSHEMTQLKRFPGVSNWKVQDKAGNWYKNHDEITDWKTKTKIATTAFPPSEEEIKSLDLHKCLRFFPHVNDTGGFFVAVLEKVGPITWPVSEEEEKKIEDGENNNLKETKDIQKKMRTKENKKSKLKKMKMKEKLKTKKKTMWQWNLKD